ncbi:hypothetical protein [uncultured Nitrospira sp.]|uniref:hypothetical protein n=1 Tax=uncultured Nitrospira sp. TaxID=157176 RepID=UPI00314059C2
MNPIARTDVSNTILLSLTLYLMVWSCLGIPSNSEAMLVAGNVLSGRELGPRADLREKSTAVLRDPQRWEKRLFAVPLPQQMTPKYDLQWKHGPNFSLKDPGKLPGIQFGVEMHSFQALEGVIPQGGLPKDIHVNRDRPLRLPPSLNAPDYNGGFFRFTW